MYHLKECVIIKLLYLKKDSGNFIYTVQVSSKSSQPNKLLQVAVVKMNKDETTTVKIPIYNPVPLFILFRALGVETDREIINFIVHDENDTEMINLLRKFLKILL